MKELVANRCPPGDRWALLEDESDIVYGNLTEIGRASCRERV